MHQTLHKNTFKHLLKIFLRNQRKNPHRFIFVLRQVSYTNIKRQSAQQCGASVLMINNTEPIFGHGSEFRYNMGTSSFAFDLGLLFGSLHSVGGFFLWGHVQNSSRRLLSVGLLYKILILSAIYFQNILYKRPTLCKRRELCDYLDRVILHTSSPFLLPVAEMIVFALRTNERNVVCILGHHHLKMMKSECNCLFSHF